MEFGIHTPKTTTIYLNLLNKECRIKFKDSSWSNDLTDSAYCEDSDVFVYFPNNTSNYNEDEKFSDFKVIYNRESMGKEYKELSFETVEEVIKEINSN